MLELGADLQLYPNPTLFGTGTKEITIPSASS